MKFLQVMILSLILLLILPLLAVESSSLTNDNIARGSSLSLNDTNPYWLSPSGNIAFGFYQLPWSPDRYVVGIWFANSPSKTLVWTANPNDLPLHKTSSILFTNDGKLVLHIMPDNKEKPLIPDLQEPASYARMHDDGNFVLYGSDSQIVWESFDYPTDTILGGQKLNAGVGLRSVSYKLSVQQGNGLVAIHSLGISCSRTHRCETGYVEKVVSWEIEGKTYSPITLNLDTSGDLYLVGADDSVLKYLYRNKNQQHEERSVYMYRATLDSEGIFNLYKERIDGGTASSSSIVWSSFPNSSAKDKITRVILFIFVIFVVIVVIAIGKCEKQARQPSSGDTESGRKYCY